MNLALQGGGAHGAFTWGVIDELLADGEREELLELIDVPAGIDIGARTAAEIALSILAKIVAVRRAAPAAPASAPAPLAVDPICGMTVAAVASTPSLERDGETFYFCSEGCKTEFEAQKAHVPTAG